MNDQTSMNSEKKDKLEKGDSTSMLNQVKFKSVEDIKGKVEDNMENFQTKQQS